MEITADTIESMTWDLESALRDMLKYGPSPDGAKRVRDAFEALEYVYAQLKNPDFHI